jgi:AcrR family transcriptional regulator
MIGAPRLRTRQGSGIYQTGLERIAQILDTALEILIEDGYQALTLREVARRCDVQIGAISYYYKSRSDLLRDVLNKVLTPYVENFKAIRHAPGLSAEVKLEKLITLLLEDLQTKRTTRLFTHLWVLANHDPFVAKAVDRIYLLERLTFSSLIAKINPALSEQERETLAVFISSAIAGSTMFLGYEKPWAKQLPLYRAIACRGLIDLVRTITSKDLQAYGWRREDLTPGWNIPTILTKAEHAAVLASARTEVHGAEAAGSKHASPEKGSATPKRRRKG